MLLSVSFNGYSVDQIGRTEYLNAIDEVAAGITQSSGQTVGLQKFAGNGPLTNPTIYFEGLLDVDTTPSGTTVSDAIQGIISSDFDNNYGNSVSNALSNAIDMFSAAGIPSTTQKFHVLFSAGNPLIGSIGDTTNAGQFDDPCSNARDAKNANIQTFVALIGEQGRNFVKEYYSCLVEDPSTDVVIIDPDDTTAGIASLLDRVCKANGYDVVITEVNPTEAGTYRPYIEILNRGASVSLKACFNSATDSTCSGSATVPTGEYFVATCGSCSGDNPASNLRDNNGLAAASTSTGWTAIAATATGSIELDRVTHGSGDYWQTSQSGRSFELRGIGYNNDYGGNWRVSCWDGTTFGGSPGADPADCVAVDNSCTVNSACQANTDTSGLCLVGNSNQFCGCSSSFLGDVDTCIVMPEFSASCTAYVITDRLGAEYVHFATDRPEWDSDISFRLGYTTTGGAGSTKVSGGLNMAAVVDADVTEDITMTAFFTAPLSDTDSQVTTDISCTVVTIAPTTSPTAEPTPMPTPLPTLQPTQSPTFGQIGVYFRGSALCTPVERCNCFSQEITCCLDPADNCEDQLWQIEIPGNAESTTKETITVGTFTDQAEFDGGVNVSYTVTAYGNVNLTEFANLAWADKNGSMGGAEKDLLAIDVSPPGGLNLSASQVLEIVAGETTGQVELDITTSTLKCEADEECINYDECLTSGVAYVIEMNSCESTTNVSTGGCVTMYPNTLYVAVSRSNQLCRITFGIGDDEEELPVWFPWVLAALILFLYCLCFLVYRFWWSQKKTAAELGDAEDELDQQHADNEQGFGKDLDVGDVAFNPMATGVPGMDRPADAFGNEIQQRQMHAQNDMVDVQAEVFQVRQDYGQVQTGMPRGGM